MVADQYITIQPDSTDPSSKSIDTEELTVNSVVVQRQRVQIAGAGDTDIAEFAASDPAGTEVGLIVRNIPSGTQPVSGTVDIGAGTAAIGSVTIGAGSESIGTVILGAGTASIGKLAAGTAEIGSLGTSTKTIGSVGLVPQTSGGLSVYRVISAGTTNAANIKSSAGQVYGWYISNSNLDFMFVKLYDKATLPDVGTDTPKMTIAVPSGHCSVEFSSGIAFTSGVGIAITELVADADTTGVLADEVVVNLLYK